MRLKNLMAVAAAFAFCTVSFVSLAANAGEVKTIDCSNASDLGLGDDSINAVRRNIYNIWGNSVEDIDANTAVSEYVTVNFTISGIGSNSARKDTESTSKYDIDGVNYVAFLGGSIGGNAARHSLSGSDASSEYITITGDGTYDVTWTLDSASENISCLYLQTNIDFTDYVPEDQKETAAKEKNIALSGITLTVNSITSVEPDKEEDTTADGTTAADDGTTAAADGTTAAADGTTAADNSTTTTAKSTTTTTAKASTTTTTAKAAASTTAATTSSTVSNTPTGDTSGIAAAFAALAVAGAAAVVSKKKD